MSTNAFGILNRSFRHGKLDVPFWNGRADFSVELRLNYITLSSIDVIGHKEYLGLWG